VKLKEYSDMETGTIQQLIRYPVKSFGGECVMSTRVMNYGLYGDRSHVFLDESREGKFLTITQYKQMALYKAAFTGAEKDEEFPEVTIVTPSGNRMNWGGEELKKEIEKGSSTHVAFKKYEPELVPAGAIEEEHILLITDASLSRLEEIWGKKKLDAMRFRPNIILSLKNKIPFAEEGWTGKKLQIGPEVELFIKRPCERCMIINVDPEDGLLSPSLLKTVVNNRENVFGMYCTVLKKGTIKTGDKTILKDV
jgi:uncharacterized protein